MSRLKKLLAGVAVTTVALGASAGALAASDTKQAPTGFFTPVGSFETTSPYYRFGGDDWGWTHGAILGSITSATLNISAFDVDFCAALTSSCEHDKIYAYDNGVQTLVGELSGLDSAFGFTSLVLGANFFDDINNGLQVFMDIDTTNGGWAVSLAKSVLLTDGGTLPNPNPTPVPEPETYAMMLAGLGLLGFVARRRKQAQAV